MSVFIHDSLTDLYNELFVSPVVMESTTINEIKYSLFLQGKIPLHVPHSIYTSHARH